MSTEKNKAIVHRVFEEGWNKRNIDFADEVIAGCSSREVDPDGDVDDEVLAVASFMREHPVVAPYRQAAQLDTVSHQCPLFRAAKHQLL